MEKQFIQSFFSKLNWKKKSRKCNLHDPPRSWACVYIGAGSWSTFLASRYSNPISLVSIISSLSHSLQFPLVFKGEFLLFWILFPFFLLSSAESDPNNCQDVSFFLRSHFASFLLVRARSVSGCSRFWYLRSNFVYSRAFFWSLDVVFEVCACWLVMENAWFVASEIGSWKLSWFCCLIWGS